MTTWNYQYRYVIGGKTYRNGFIWYVYLDFKNSNTIDLIIFLN